MKIALEALRPIWKTNPATLEFLHDDIGFCKSVIVSEHLLYLDRVILLPSPTFARGGDGVGHLVARPRVGASHAASLHHLAQLLAAATDREPEGREHHFITLGDHRLGRLLRLARHSLPGRQPPASPAEHGCRPRGAGAHGLGQDRFGLLRNHGRPRMAALGAPGGGRGRRRADRPVHGVPPGGRTPPAARDASSTPTKPWPKPSPFCGRFRGLGL